MQASVHTFAADTGTGSVLLDTGRVLPFPADVFAASGLRHLRLGQRLSIQVSGDPEQEGTELTRLWIVGIGPGEVIR
jgi:cold shock CspA family protein